MLHGQQYRTSSLKAATIVVSAPEHAAQIHGWCLCLAWGWFIPAGIVIASCRSLTRLGSNWWYYLHIAFQIIGLLLSLTGVAVGTYFPANEELMVQHKKIGIVVNVVAGLQVTALHGFGLVTQEAAFR